MLNLQQDMGSNRIRFQFGQFWLCLQHSHNQALHHPFRQLAMSQDICGFFFCLRIRSYGKNEITYPLTGGFCRPPEQAGIIGTSPEFKCNSPTVPLSVRVYEIAFETALCN